MNLNTDHLFQTFLDLVSELERQDSASPERIEIVEECLHNIGRRDLVNKVTAYKMSGENII